MRSVQIKWLIYSLVLLISLFICLKFIFWMSLDMPMSRLSVVYLMLILICLFLRNKISFLLLIGLTIFPFVFKMINTHLSGYLFTEFSSVLLPLTGKEKTVLGIQIIDISYLIYLFILTAILIIPGIRKFYWNKTLEKERLL